MNFGEATEGTINTGTITGAEIDVSNLRIKGEIFSPKHQTVHFDPELYKITEIDEEKGIIKLELIYI